MFGIDEPVEAETPEDEEEDSDLKKKEKKTKARLRTRGSLPKSACGVVNAAVFAGKVFLAAFSQFNL